MNKTRYFPDRTADALEAWLRERPGVEVACRDGSATYAGAVRRGLPDTVRVTERWRHPPAAVRSAMLSALRLSSRRRA